MFWIYNIGISFYTLLIKFAASFNPKAKLFITGRKNIFHEIAEKINPDDRAIWFHFASLGEFEQGRPVLEAIKLKQPEQKFIITFFSPSGYEIRKNYALADVFYLPIDTADHAEKFLKLVNPRLAIFTKYEFWHHYFKKLNERQIPLYLISGIFRPNQVFFKWYGVFYRNILKNVTHFFVQNNESVGLLKSIGINNVTLNGDTRFDRVYEHTINVKKLSLIESFCGNLKVFIAGSTWLPDEKLLVSLLEKYPDWKFIIAPHEINESHLKEIEVLFHHNTIRYSVFNHEIDKKKLADSKQILIIDNIGILSSIYQYANLAYIGGGFGAGIHNTLEAAAFGLPIIFGPKFNKFQEAKDLIALGAAKSVANEIELHDAFDFLKFNEEAITASKKYVKDKKGASDLIVNMIKI